MIALIALALVGSAVVAGDKLSAAFGILQNEGFGGIRDRIVTYDLPFVQPTVAWEASSVSDFPVLDRFVEQIAKRDTQAFLLIKDGEIAYEWYSPDHNVNKPYGTAAMTKALMGSMVLAVSLHDGSIKLDDPASKYIPAWVDDPVRSQIKVKHLANHTSGIENVSFRDDAGREGWKVDYYDNRDSRFEMAQVAAPIEFWPGTEFEYSGVAFYALAYALTASNQGASQSDIFSIYRDRVMSQIGVPTSAYSVSYKESYDIDGMTMYATGSGAKFTARSVARIGQFVLNEGQWDGKQIVDSQWIDAVTRYSGFTRTDANNSEPGAVAGWWTNSDGYFPELPDDTVIGAGAGHQALVIIPSLNVVMVRLGGPMVDDDANTGPRYWEQLEAQLLNPGIEAINESFGEDSLSALNIVVPIENRANTAISRNLYLSFRAEPRNLEGAP